MSEQFSLFGAPPAPPAPPPAPSPDPARADERVYTVVPRGDRYAVNWTCGEYFGVLGGLYESIEDAERGIEFRKELLAQGITDPRPWMRTPPEGTRP